MKALDRIFLFIKLIVVFMFFYSKEIILSNARVAKFVLSRRLQFHDKIAEFKAPLSNSIQMVLLMNLVTMTPGTISLSFDEDLSQFRVHFLFDDEIADFQRKLDLYYIPFLKAVSP